MDVSIAAAVREVIAAHGYGGLTVDAVALSAGVSKATIYRRYSSKQEMTFAVLLHDLEEVPPADTGSLHGDLTALARQIAAQVSGPGGDTLSSLLADIRADPNLRARFEQTFIAVERGIITTVLDRALARGELAARPDPVLVQALLLGPLYTWLVVLDEDPTHTTDLADLVATMATTALAAGALPATIRSRSNRSR